jgi:hypothetical protein
MEKKRKKQDPDWWADWLERRRQLELLWERRAERFAAADAREAAYRARLRRLTFGLLGREPEGESEGDRKGRPYTPTA